MELDDDNGCFVCGKGNPHGLKLDFEMDREARMMTTVFTPRKEHQGYVDITHGGLISTVLDEAMTKLAYELGNNAVTAKLTVKFKKPMKVGERVIITGRLVSESGRAINAEANAVLEDGTVVAEAAGLLMRIKQWP
ncbi:MAG TPA: PaaI family thioesterase [Nitrospirota bacterium]